MPNKWRTINSLVHKIRLHGRRGKGTAESFSREKLRQAPQEQGGELSCTGMTFLPCDPGWCVRKPDVQNKWHGNTTHPHIAEENVLVYIARTALRTTQKLLTIHYNVLFIVYLNNTTPALWNPYVFSVLYLVSYLYLLCPTCILDSIPYFSVRSLPECKKQTN